MARQGFGAGDGGGGVQNVAEGDGAHRAGELAGCLRRAVRQEQVFLRHVDGSGGLARVFLHQAGFVHTLTYVVISQAIVIAEFIIYFIVFNLAKVKNLEIVNEGRRIRNKVRANNKQIRIIRNSITRDKDESVYNLGKYDEKLSELEAEREDISNRKLEAIKVFENDTKQVITDEITGRRQPKIDALKADLKQLEEKINAMESQLADMQSHLTDSYVTFLGKDLLTEEKLSDLISIMEEGTASTVSGAIEVYKGES